MLLVIIDGTNNCKSHFTTWFGDGGRGIGGGCLVLFDDSWIPKSVQRYGLDSLKRFGYKTLDPPTWTVPPHPRTKFIEEEVLTLLIVGGFGLWA
jgi:hypothetical protein